MLYHVSLEYVSLFEPRIPSITLLNENKSTKRICFSRSIQGALTALQSNVNLLSGMINLEKKNKCPAILHIYCIDEDVVGSENIIDNSLVCKNVPDAFATEEVWITKTIKSEDMTHLCMKLKDFNYKKVRIVDNWHICRITQLSLKQASFSEIESNFKFWNSIATSYTNDTKKEFTIETKRGSIALFSTEEVAFENESKCS